MFVLKSNSEVKLEEEIEKRCSGENKNVEEMI